MSRPLAIACTLIVNFGLIAITAIGMLLFAYSF